MLLRERRLAKANSTDDTTRVREPRVGPEVSQPDLATSNVMPQFVELLVAIATEQLRWAAREWQANDLTGWVHAQSIPLVDHLAVNMADEGLLLVEH